MKRKLVKFLLISLFIASAFFLQAQRQWKLSEATQRIEQIKQFVIAGGGNINATNNSFKLSSTVGQIDVDVRESGTFKLYPGFWIPRDTTTLITINSPSADASFEIGENLEILWSTKVEIDSVYIELSRNNGSSWDTLFTIENDGMEIWPVEFPKSSSCRIRISDTKDARRAEQSSSFAIDPKREDLLIKPGQLTFGSEETAYRMISVPLELQNPDPTSVLVDNLGSYNIKNWRFFDYRNSVFQEFDDPNRRNFEPGRAFLLIIRDSSVVIGPEKIIDAGPGELVADSVRTLDLEVGWNFVANPFNTDILASSFSIPGQTFELKEYNGDWSQLDINNSVLKPWQGYALKVDNQNEYVLEIRPKFTSGQTLSKGRQADEGDGWSIQIKAQCQAAFDQENFAGIRTDASEEWDGFDSYEPPAIGEYVRVYFPHREWSYRPDIYSADFQPPNNRGHVWEFVAGSRIEDTVNLTFEGLKEVPAEFKVWLINDLLKTSQDIRKGNIYQFENLKQGQIHKFSLIVGDDRFVKEHLAQAEIIPLDYQLSQNFPNPFNLRTVIRYSLPEPQKVTLKIYNYLGQEVVTLIDEEPKETGFHTESWDGRNNYGRVVGSGVYIYYFQAGSFTKTEKMVLVK